MNAKQFFESIPITDASAPIDKLKHKFSVWDLINFAEAYLKANETRKQLKAITQ